MQTWVEIGSQGDERHKHIGVYSYFVKEKLRILERNQASYLLKFL